GAAGTGLGLGGADYATVPHADALNLAGGLTVSAWIRPEQRATQYVVKKASQGSVNGYELGLSSSGTVFLRVNHAASGDKFRIDSSSLYAVDGSWTHVAGTYDGSMLRIYVNG